MVLFDLLLPNDSLDVNALDGDNVRPADAGYIKVELDW
jgi:hypothetical protein